MTALPAPQTAPLPTIVAGTVFDTPFEQGCVALTAPDELGNFEALDSDGVVCLFCLMVGAMPITPRDYPQEG